MLRTVVCLLAGLSLSAGRAGAPTTFEKPAHKVASLKITILSTMLAEEGMGEWG